VGARGDVAEVDCPSESRTARSLSPIPCWNYPMQKSCARLVKRQQIMYGQHEDIGSGGGALVYTSSRYGSAAAPPTLQSGIKAFADDQALTVIING